MNRAKVTNLLLFTLSLLVVLQLVLPYTSILFNGYSFHQSTLGFTYCKQEKDCRHEVGHLMDTELGHISRTSVFGSALMIHLAFSFEYGQVDDYTRLILSKEGILSYSENYKPYHYGAGSSPQEELYADIYDLSGGDISKIPLTLRPLFSEDSRYETVYDELVENKVYISNQGVITMKEQFAALWGKVVENKEIAIRVGCAVGGAVLGAVVTVVVLNAQQDYLLEEMETSIVEEATE